MSPSMNLFDRILSFAARNERKLGAVLFAFGFVTDFLTFGLLPLSIVVLVFAGYLTLAVVSVLGAHATASCHDSEIRWKKALSVLFPLAVQYAFGGLFSGFTVFYATHSVILVSWPFLIILGLIYAGNEYFRMYKHFLIFQTTLLFFALYAYAVFAFPFYTGFIGPWSFLGSTGIAVGVFALFLWVLSVFNPARFRGEVRSVMITTAAVLLVVNVSYFAGLIPPIPLALKDAGIYHSLVREGNGYRVTDEAPEPWWVFEETIETTPGETLYAYSAVAAPGNLRGGAIVHRWEYYNPTSRRWITESNVSFPMTGGREGGYRGYSWKSNLVTGKWRVSVETPGGQTIGRIGFTVMQVNTPPPLETKVL